VDVPEGDDRGWGVSASGGPWFAVLGQAYDDDTGQVLPLGRPSGTPDYGMSAAWAGDRLVVFGGASQGLTDPVELSGGAWMWTP
jgi:hypothetical protein